MSEPRPLNQQEWEEFHFLEQLMSRSGRFDNYEPSAADDRRWQELRGRVCRRTPYGWRCSRGAGHKGPCAARPNPGPAGGQPPSDGPHDLKLEFQPSQMTPESLESWLNAAATELTRILPELRVVLGKMEAAKQVSAELLRRRMGPSDGMPSEETRTVEQYRAERNEAMAVARSLVDDPFPDNLHLADVIEKYVYRAGQTDGAAGVAEGMTPEMMLHDIQYWSGEAHRLGEEAASLQRENERLNRRLVEMYCRIIPEEIAKGVDKVLEAIEAERPVAYAAERGSRRDEQLSAKPEQINATEGDDLTTLGLTVLRWYAAVREAKDSDWLKIERGSALAKSMDDMLRTTDPAERAVPRKEGEPNEPV